MPFLFEKLDVYNKSMQLADEITTLVETLSQGDRRLNAFLFWKCAEGNN
jgi:hypothetical protein